MKKVAIVGSGVSGLSAAWLLSLNKKDFKVTVFEADDYPGGHAHTVDIQSLDLKETIGVDTGFIVCNNVTYPNFLNLLDQLNVNLIDSDMSFAVSRNNGELEWAGKNLNTIFGQRSNLLNHDMWKLIQEVIQFNNQATKIAQEADQLPPNQHPLANMTLKDFLSDFKYSKFFYENYLLPMTAAIWSTPAETTFDLFPLVTLVQFMNNHQLLQVLNRPKWKTLQFGSRSYVNKIVETLDDLRLNEPVISIKRRHNGVLVETKNGVEEFDSIIMATHTDQSLQILGDDATADEKKILGSIKYVLNRAYLHRDVALMPKLKLTWSSWNYLTNVKDEIVSRVMCLTYWMNNLQPFVDPKVFGHVFVTMNPLTKPDPALTLGAWDYTHPLYSPETIQAQNELPKIQNVKNTVFAGAWTNYGFHEDGATSGLLAAQSLGAKSPFPIVTNGGFPKANHTKTTSNLMGYLSMTLVISFVVVVVSTLQAI
ncbi:amine oxidase [Globomyces pollinis-pini]|nr:amine oxidase [Globomyces pollinis-pini]